MTRQRLLVATVFVAAVPLLVIGVASALAYAFSAAEDRAPESLLPADSAIYLGWDGTEKHKADWEKSACYEALDKSRLAKTIVDFGMSYIPADSPIPAASVRQLLEGLARRGFSVSVAFPKGQSVPRVMLILHQAAALEAGFNMAIPKIADKETQFQTSTIRGRRVTRASFPSSPGNELAWWTEGGHLVLVFGQHAVDAALDVADGKSPPISQSDNWHRFRESKDYPVLVAAWCDVAALRARYADHVLQEKTEKEPRFTVGQLIDLLGGEHVGCLGMRSGLKERALVSDVVFEAPRLERGIPALIDQAEITLADLPPLPSTNSGFFMASFNWSKAYDTILDMVRKIADASTNGGAAKVDDAIEKAPDVLGFNPKALLDSLGHVGCVYSDTAAGIPGGFGFGVALSVDKPEALKNTLKIALQRLQAVIPNGAFTVAEEERSGRPFWVFDISNFPIHPAAALDKHWLFIGLTPQSIESELLRVDGKLDAWKPSEAERMALDSVPKKFTVLSLSDPRPLYSAVVTYLPLVAGFINQAAEQAARQSGHAGKVRGRMALLADLPPAEVITRPMFPNVTAATVDAKGIRFQSRESAPGVTAGVFVAAPVMVALLLPAVQAAREAARRTQSRNNLKQIALSLHNYHDVHRSFPQGTYPNANLKPEKRLSWQAEILPLIEQQNVYNQIDFKKAWDDPANQQAIGNIIPTYLNPSNGETKINGLPVTQYVGLAGFGPDGPMLPVTSPRAGVFAYDRVTRIRDITDGTSNTIMTSECVKGLGSWAAGGRPTIRPLTKRPYIDGPDGLGGQHPGGCMFGMADGSVRFISQDVDPRILEAMSTIAGGESVGAP